MAGVVVAWEREARAAEELGVRVVNTRTGMVLSETGGALQKMLPPFKLGVGGPVGSGHQYWPWIHRRDWIELVRWAITTSTASGRRVPSVSALRVTVLSFFTT